MTDALTYDKQQGFSRAEIEFIQRIVGTTPDGAWGPNTVAAIQRWQTARGIPADGKVARKSTGNTWPKLLAAGADAWWQGSAGISRVGLWTFSDAADPNSAAHQSALQIAADAALTDVSFTLNDDTHSTFTLAQSVDNVVAAGRAFKDKGVDVSLNLFVYPSTTYVDALADAALAIHERLGLRRIDIDAEELWIEHGTGSDKDAAAARLGERMRGTGLPLAINGIVYTNRTALDPLVQLDVVTSVVPQAYSVAGKTSDGKPNRVYNPIDLQATAERNWGGWWPDRTIVGGFATYNQAGAYELGTLDEHTAIGLAMRAWADLGAREVFGWSIKQANATSNALMQLRVSSATTA